MLCYTSVPLERLVRRTPLRCACVSANMESFLHAAPTRTFLKSKSKRKHKRAASSSILLYAIAFESLVYCKYASIGGPCRKPPMPDLK